MPMSDYAMPLSISITHEQLAWLDERRRHGSLSRSAALRQVLDAVIAAEQGAAPAVTLKEPLHAAGAVAGVR